MIYQPDYTLKIDGQDVNFLFTSLTYKKFCDRKGIELDYLLKMVQKSFAKPEDITDEMKQVKDLKIEDYIDILLSANETYCIYHRIPFNADIPDAYQWVDALGGFVSGLQKRNSLILLFVAKLLNVDLGVLSVEAKPVEQVEKNAVAPVVNGSPGASSTSGQQQPV